MECSENKKCIHEYDQDYSGCLYSMNLKNGRVFYGSKAFYQTTPDKTAPEVAASTNRIIYLYCFNRVFKISSRTKSGWSMKLTTDQAKEVAEAFTSAGVPFKVQIDSEDECTIDCPTPADPSPANSRVVFEVSGTEYHIHNFNGWMIKRKNADLIAKALKKHGINARYEQTGYYAGIEKVEVESPAACPVDRRDEPASAADIYESQEINPPATSMWPGDEAKVQTDDKSGIQMSLLDTGGQPPEMAIEPEETPKIKGLYIIAKDEYWGTYRGQLAEIYNKALSTELMAKVLIIDTIKQPRQDAILDALGRFDRVAYPPGSIHNFDTRNISLCWTFEEDDYGYSTIGQTA
jgi:hypothetical protein